MATQNYPLGKENTYEAVRLVVWLWPGLHAEKWSHKLICAHLLSQSVQRMLPDKTKAVDAQAWAMVIALMLNGTEQIYGDLDPFNAETGVSSEVQAWRLMLLRSFPFLSHEGRVVGGLGRIALNALNIGATAHSEFHRTHLGLGADSVHYLNYEGQGNSIVWYKSLDVKNHQSNISACLSNLLKAWQECIALVAEKLPITSLFSSHLTRHRLALVTIENSIPKMVPSALANIADMMAPLQDSIPLEAQKQLGEKAKQSYQLKPPAEPFSKPQHLKKSELLELLTSSVSLFESQKT